ncbi:MAG: AN1-type zinc finger domain-containing protein [Candidatus Sigynarchaeota archaeon]
MKCQHCGIDAYLGFTCRQCGKYYCAKDRLPENHKCAFLGAARDERQYQIQLANASVQRSYGPANQAARPMDGNRSFSRPLKAPKETWESPLPEDLDDEENNGNRFVAIGPAGGMPLYPLIFGIFAAFDVINLIVVPSIWTLLPVIVHGIFLPVLMYQAYQQAKGIFPPRTMVMFIQLLIAYMVVYLAVAITMGLVVGNFVGVAINIFIGICMVMMWSRVLQQMRFAFGDR